METREIELSCKNCKQVFKTPVRPLLKYFEKHVSISCDNCQASQQIAVTKELFLYGGSDTSKTTILDSGSDRWMSGDRLFLRALGSENEKTNRFEIKEGQNILGRKPQTEENENGIAIETNDRRISRTHCAIWLVKKVNLLACTIRDMKSVNGTFLNGEKLHQIDEVYLKRGDVIGIGDLELRLEL